MISCTRVSKNGRLAGTSKARRFATASPIKIAAMSPASSRTMSQAAATPTTHASWAVVASRSSSSSLHRHSHSTATPASAPAAPTPTDSRNWPTGRAAPPLVLASTAWNTAAPKMPPTGSISEPSQDKIRCSRSDGRAKASSGPTTVGPDTTKIAPVISAAPADMPSSGPASTAANAIVTGTPQITSRGTTRRARPPTLPHSRARPESYKITATASETSGENADPSRRSGLTSVVSAPAVKPAGSKMISAGIRSRLASTCEPTASTTIRPTPNRTWSVLIACPSFRQPSLPHQAVSPRGAPVAACRVVRLASRLEAMRPAAGRQALRARSAAAITIAPRVPPRHHPDVAKQGSLGRHGHRGRITGLHPLLPVPAERQVAALGSDGTNGTAPAPRRVRWWFASSRDSRRRRPPRSCPG